MASLHENRPSRFLVGLTGGIASGKSLVAGCFADLGVAVVDTDVVAREVVEPGTPALSRIVDAFGREILDESGALDRKALRKIVFDDDASRRTLEAILHPVIRDETFRQAESAAGPYVIIVVPLLFESPIREAMDRILVVDCSEQTQEERLMARDKESAEQARRIMATQATRKERLSIADDVIKNDNTPEAACEAVAALHETYLEMAHRED
jgi:dephospho-CoA kinase